ncbi:hypothetical protein O6H91_09G097800 [Diphasiastrum complanatum]|uniref:Uncharacterized protein n=1 Tax=Diphasiastrum complanatum TaxID=34168 RepID=A0ACC2CS87_DIPCM|nr:hypothetical protein O6H91_09G097800 [Diphasiastrum complanatum]
MARNPKKKNRSKAAKNRQNGSSSEATLAPAATRVWQPGVDGIEDGEELQFDPSAYDCLHAFQLGWPCLSFDIVRDALGGLRSSFPHTMLCVAGTQADVAANNAVVVVRLSNITGMKRKQPLGGNDESESDSDSSDEDEDITTEVGAIQPASKNPVLQVRMVAHQGCVNRIRAMQQQPQIVATWADTGYVWDVGVHIRSLSSGSAETSTGLSSIVRQAPLQIFTGHKEEGFALDWSPLVPGRLVTGDCKSFIYLWEPSEGGRWNVENTPFSGHKSSVEDLQWSPTEASVFASCSIDGTIAIWDVRSRTQAAISVKAHDADVNVISWNRLASCMIASGSDDGIFRIWDLRSFKDDSFIAHFKYHNAPITSIEWSPHEASTVAATSADNQLTIWDLSLERDAEEEAAYQAQLEQKQAEAPEDLPPQLLFVHQGQKNLKELHWHPQIHGLMVATSGDGFNVFRPSNLDNLAAS